MSENINPVNLPAATFYPLQKDPSEPKLPPELNTGASKTGEDEFVAVILEEEPEPVLPPDENNYDGFTVLEPEPELPPEPKLPPDETFSIITTLEPEPVLPPDEAEASLASQTAGTTPAVVKFSLENGTVSQTMLDSLKGWENFKPKAYKCPSGQWTIGYGHTKGVKAGQTVTKEQAEALLKEDISEAEKTVKKLAKEAKLELTQGQYDALVSFTYNCGIGTLPKSGLIDLIKKGNIDGAAKKMKEYVKGGGKVLPGLVARRETETGWLYS